MFNLNKMQNNIKSIIENSYKNFLKEVEKIKLEVLEASIVGGFNQVKEKDAQTGKSK